MKFLGQAFQKLQHEQNRQKETEASGQMRLNTLLATFVADNNEVHVMTVTVISAGGYFVTRYCDTLLFGVTRPVMCYTLLKITLAVTSNTSNAL